MHIRAAVAARKHIFAEKPVAVDVPGAKTVLEACTEARRHRLSIVSGLCWRYHLGKRATMARIHDGAVGDIVAIHTSYNTGTLWNRAREQGWSDMEFQMRNWLYYTWLSGDHIVEQHIHSLDKVAWAMRDTYPTKAVGLGGRQVRTGPEFGHIFDHHAVVFEYANGAKCFSFTRQQAGCANDVNDYILGTQGKCNMMAHRITGRNEWSYPAAQNRQDPDMYQNEHNELFRSIRRGEPINNGEWMTKSTLMAIMGRMATYTGQEITWDRLMESTQNLSPQRYAWGEMPTPEVAKPGVTRFS
jgi:predicted dehydrogenase